MNDALPLPDLDQAQLEADRLAHLQQTMSAFDLPAMLLTNPVSIRYATGYRNYALFPSHIPSAYLLVAAEGPAVLHGGYGGDHKTIAEARPAHSTAVFDAGLEPWRAAAALAGDVKRFLAETGLASTAVFGVERLPPSVTDALRGQSLALTDAEPVVELARSQKLDGELVALRHSIVVAEFGTGAMAESLRPGITENQLWSVLHQPAIVTRFSVGQITKAARGGVLGYKYYLETGQAASSPAAIEERYSLAGAG